MIDPRRPRYALLLAIIVCMVPFMVARCEAFEPCFDTSSGPVRLTLIESPLPWLECAAIAGQLGAHADALLMAASPTPACAVWSTAPPVITPRSGATSDRSNAPQEGGSWSGANAAAPARLGWIVALPFVPDYVIGREARHALFGEDYAVAGIPIFGECK